MTETSARDEIRAAVDEVIDAQNAGDAASLRLAGSERTDAAYIGTDPRE
jgi:hypothetical protein